MFLNMLHLAMQLSEITLKGLSCLYTLVFIFKICLLGKIGFFLCVTLMRKTHHKMDGCQQKRYAGLLTWYFEYQISAITERKDLR